jgi:hypothetical protein
MPALPRFHFGSVMSPIESLDSVESTHRWHLDVIPAFGDTACDACCDPPVLIAFHGGSSGAQCTMSLVSPSRRLSHQAPPSSI